MDPVADPTFLDKATLQSIWFLLLTVLLTGYAILDGFDLGVGINHLLVGRSDIDRRTTIGSIGPIWDGNEVWLVTFGGALFAAFPVAYASFFSGFYIAFMLLLLGLIMRAVCLEFRVKTEGAAMHRVFDFGFSLGSVLIALLLGVAAGNCLYGIKVDSALTIREPLLSQLNPFSLMTGLMTVALFALHGTLYLRLRVEGALLASVERWAWRWWWIFLALFIAVSAYALRDIPQVTANIRNWPVLWAIPALNVLAILNVPRTIRHRQPMFGFISSSCMIMAFAALFSMALYPDLIRSTIDPAFNVTISNASSSPRTLTTMLIIALIGMPIVIAYTVAVYWIFRGKVRVDRGSY